MPTQAEWGADFHPPGCHKSPGWYQRRPGREPGLSCPPGDSGVPPLCGVSAAHMWSWTPTPPGSHEELYSLPSGGVSLSHLESSWETLQPLPAQNIILEA